MVNEVLIILIPEEVLIIHLPVKVLRIILLLLRLQNKGKRERIEKMLGDIK
jgi:hypothetical protein